MLAIQILPGNRTHSSRVMGIDLSHWLPQQLAFRDRWSLYAKVPSNHHGFISNGTDSCSVRPKGGTATYFRVSILILVKSNFKTLRL